MSSASPSDGPCQLPPDVTAVYVLQFQAASSQGLQHALRDMLHNTVPVITLLIGGLVVEVVFTPISSRPAVLDAARTLHPEVVTTYDAVNAALQAPLRARDRRLLSLYRNRLSAAARSPPPIARWLKCAAHDCGVLLPNYVLVSVGQEQERRQHRRLNHHRQSRHQSQSHHQHHRQSQSSTTDERRANTGSSSVWSNIEMEYVYQSQNERYNSAGTENKDGMTVVHHGRGRRQRHGRLPPTAPSPSMSTGRRNATPVTVSPMPRDSPSPSPSPVRRSVTPMTVSPMPPRHSADGSPTSIFAIGGEEGEDMVRFFGAQGDRGYAVPIDMREEKSVLKNSFDVLNGMGADEE